MRYGTHIAYFFILALMALPALQKELDLFPERKLEGDFVPAERPDFAWHTWYRGEFQANLDTYLNDNIGFNALLVRFTNQIDLSLFNYIHADGVVKGKRREFFEYDYIRSYTGMDFLGERYIDKKVRRLKFVQDHLKDSLGIDLIFILEPGKASFYPEYIPDRYLEQRKKETNYSTILHKLREYGVRFVDWNSWFMRIKDTSAHPLFGQYGTHWSLYGASLAADSLVNLIEGIRGIDLPEVSMDSLVVEHRARPPDYDIAAAMNLLFRLNDRQPLAYPAYRFTEPDSTKTSPMVLAVGDSYYWNIFNSGIPGKLFAHEAFWYFGKLVYPDYYIQPLHVDDLDLRQEVEKQDVVLLMTTERFLYKFDWTLVDRLYSIYGKTSQYDRVYHYAGQITSNDDWFSMLISKAKLRNKTLEEILLADARYIYRENEPERYAVLFGVSDREETIRKDESWMRTIREKADIKGITLEEMIRQDAEYMFASTDPDAFEIYREIRQMAEIIRQDRALLEETGREAAYYRLDLEEMLQIKAEELAAQSTGR